jgi:hypothetical protein
MADLRVTSPLHLISPKRRLLVPARRRIEQSRGHFYRLQRARDDQGNTGKRPRVHTGEVFFTLYLLLIAHALALGSSVHLGESLGQKCNS